jgi:hypothetical protein
MTRCVRLAHAWNPGHSSGPPQVHDAVVGSVIRDEPMADHRFVSRAKLAAAFRRISRSISYWATRLSSRATPCVRTRSTHPGHRLARRPHGLPSPSGWRGTRDPSRGGVVAPPLPRDLPGHSRQSDQGLSVSRRSKSSARSSSACRQSPESVGACMGARVVTSSSASRRMTAPLDGAATASRAPRSLIGSRGRAGLCRRWMARASRTR